MYLSIRAFAILAFASTPVMAQDQPAKGGQFWSGDWNLTVGATGLYAPSFEGSKKNLLRAIPIISLGKAGPEARFSSRNDGISIALYDSGRFRAGVNGKILFGRESKDELAGLDEVRFGGEIGGFAEVYPTENIRVRAEARHGIRSHKGIVAEVAVDAFHDVRPDIRVSGGPRLSVASADYFDAYYGVDAAESAASGLSEYKPGSGIRSVGVGGAVTWKTTEALTTSVFAEYDRLMGPAADSSLVKERGSRDQFSAGISLSYRFGFRID